MNKIVEVFPWNKNFESGIAQIDEQHKEIVSLVNQIAGYLVNHSDTDSLDQIFSTLKEYAVHHFQSEEIIWEQYLSQDTCLNDHKQAHTGFVSKVFELQEEKSRKPTQKIIEDILSFLTHWLAHHILDSDMRMSKTILAMKSGMSMNDAKHHANLAMSDITKIILDTTLSVYDSLCKKSLNLHKEINERKSVEERLHLASRVFYNTLEAICITNSDGFIVDANHAFFQSTNYEKHDVIGQHIGRYKSGLNDSDFMSSIWQQLKNHDHWNGKIKSCDKNGDFQVERLALSTIKDDQGLIINYIGIFSNISNLLESQHKLEHIAHHDNLTKLPNRLLLADRLNQAIANAKRRNERFAVSYLDLDGFKPVNDRYGHATGDQLLCSIAKRIKNIIRGNDTVARVGGDEFVVLFNELKQPDDYKALLDRLLNEIAQPINIQQNNHHVTASIGVALFPDDGNDSETLLHLSDIAMYEAKRLGKSRYQLYTA
jgi:diguanylate cyclase (GGDEF)-like protein/hemerythrin-like metal-binding protein/PAS domain S-box-containing protein